MIKKISILVIVLITQITFAQKAQKIGYVDTEYILENVPEYTTAQSKLDAKISNWNSSLNKLKNEIEAMKLALSNEKALLTSDLIVEREEDIAIKETELKENQAGFFGTSGDLFMLKKQLVQPIQDQIFDAIQEISKAKKFDMIFEKSSNDVVMLYTNPKYDVSELVLQKIVKGRKKKANLKKKSDRELAREKKQKELKTAKEARMTKREKMQAKIKLQQEARAAKREAAIKANKERREQRIIDAKAKREGKETPNSSSDKNANKDSEKENKVSPKVKKEDNPEKKADKKDEVENKKSEKEISEPKKNTTVAAKTKAEIREEKRKALVERANAKKAKRDSLKKAAAEKRAKKLAEIEDRKRKLEENKNN